MILNVKVNNQVFEVEVMNTNDRPILVYVEGEQFEVWPETSMADLKAIPNHDIENSNNTIIEITSRINSHPHSSATSHSSRESGSNHKLCLVRAPIPGVITAVFVKSGSEVSIGQELCKLEAMKMNNSIRSNHAGIIGNIFISIGQHVKHGEILMEFTD
jgi:biotin carboxyl carrier protein